MSSSGSHGSAEIIASAASLIFGLIIIFYMIPAQVMDPSPIIPNAKTFPYVLAGGFTLLSCKWVFNSLFKKVKDTTQPSSPRKLFVGFGIGAIFLFIGFLIGTSGYLIGGAIATTSVIIAIEGEHRWRMSLAAGLAITLTFTMIFGKLLHIELPIGLLSLF